MTENVWNSGMYEEDIKIKSTNPKWRKLVDYYNQMREERFGEKGYFKYTNRFDNVHIISKNMGFIEWLVDNDKIDLMKLDSRIALSEFNKTERFLMALSIQDNPISLLLSFLI